MDNLISDSSLKFVRLYVTPILKILTPLWVKTFKRTMFFVCEYAKLPKS